mmetsp:Transcript_33217/g.62005  ORF Transcript_33217/g.62005 Transcript_33217/m.62005 type:complete len:203 (+) Transcript_33217:42-650(+)
MALRLRLYKYAAHHRHKGRVGLRALCRCQAPSQQIRASLQILQCHPQFPLPWQIPPTPAWPTSRLNSTVRPFARLPACSCFFVLGASQRFVAGARATPLDRRRGSTHTELHLYSPSCTRKHRACTCPSGASPSQRWEEMTPDPLPPAAAAPARPQPLAYHHQNWQTLPQEHPDAMRHPVHSVHTQAKLAVWKNCLQPPCLDM